MAGSWIVIAAIVLVGSAAGTDLGPARCGPQSNYAVCLDSMCCSVDGFCGYSKEFCMERCHSQCSDEFLNATGSERDMMQKESISSTQEIRTSSSSDGSIHSRKMNPASRSIENKMTGKSNINTIITSDAFSRMFPERNIFYTFDSVVEAMKSFPDFANSGDMITQKREMAAFLAHIYRQTNGLCMIDQPASTDSEFCDSSNKLYPCVAGKSYQARGPLQITWNANYGMAGKEIGANLLASPEMVSRDSVLSFGTAIWQWMSPASITSTSANGGIHSSSQNTIGSRSGTMVGIMKENIPSCHEVMVDKWVPTKSQAEMGMSAGSFGLTTFMLGGDMECGAKADPSMALQRAHIYSAFCSILGVEAGHNLDCSAIGPV